MEKTISIEYLLYACDDDYELVEKLCGRLNGLRLNFSTDQLNRIKVQRLLLNGETVSNIAKQLHMTYNAVFRIKSRMENTSLIYYTGDSNEKKQRNNTK